MSLNRKSVQSKPEKHDSVGWHIVAWSLMGGVIGLLTASYLNFWGLLTL